MMDVPALGELLIDFVHKGNNEFGSPIMHGNPGGAPCNFLCALASCGEKTAFIGKVGDDAFGHMLKKTLDTHGIDTTGLVIDPSVFTTLAFVTLDETGDRTFSFARKPGADTMLRPDEVRDEQLANTRVFHFGTLSMTNEPARSATKQAVEKARQNGAMITFDPNYRAPLWNSEEEAKEQILWGIRHCDVLKISKEELELVFQQNVEQGAETLLENGVKLAFVTLGKNGVYAKNRQASTTSPAFLELKTVDTTGAGDIFGGSAVYGVLASGKAPETLTEDDLQKICQFANAMAGLSTTRSGGITSVPKKQEAIAYLQQSGLWA